MRTKAGSPRPILVTVHSREGHTHVIEGLAFDFAPGLALTPEIHWVMGKPEISAKRWKVSLISTGDSVTGAIHLPRRAAERMLARLARLTDWTRPPKVIRAEIARAEPWAVKAGEIHRREARRIGWVPVARIPATDEASA